MTGGFILPRQVFTEGLWADALSLRLYLWIVGNAVFSKEGVQFGDIKVERGQYLRSIRKLCEDLSYNEGRKIITPDKTTLMRSAYRLNTLGKLSFYATPYGTLYTVTNYEELQSFSAYENSSRDNSRDRRETDVRQSRDRRETIITKEKLKRNQEKQNPLTPKGERVPLEDLLEIQNDIPKKKRGRPEPSSEKVWEFPPLWGEKAQEAFHRWIDYRKAMKKPASEASLLENLKRYASEPKKFYAAVSFTISKDWQGLAEDPTFDKSQKTPYLAPNRKISGADRYQDNLKTFEELYGNQENNTPVASSDVIDSQGHEGY